MTVHAIAVRDRRALCAVGHLAVPDEALHHRFYVEALANARLADAKDPDDQRVIGTLNTGSVELYGWGSNVGRHADNTGFVYLLPLTVSPTSRLYCAGAGWLRVARGRVIRLWDHAIHWTTDSGPCVCAFLGSFKTPDDEVALDKLAAGVAALARGDYYGAPRVREGFRAYLPDECLVSDDRMDHTESMLLADATASGRFVIPCSVCDRPAMRLDGHWPYHWENNRCREHIGVSIPPTAPQTPEQIQAFLDEPLSLLEPA